MNSVDGFLFEENIFDLYEKEISPDIEVNYCEICREIEYSKLQYRLKYCKKSDICELCQNNDAEITHHIIYRPEETIRVCRSCHGYIHHNTFPNPLWKQKRIKNITNPS